MKKRRENLKIVVLTVEFKNIFSNDIYYNWYVIHCTGKITEIVFLCFISTYFRNIFTLVKL